MLHKTILSVAVPSMIILSLLFSCSDSRTKEAKAGDDISSYREEENTNLAERGAYLVTAAGCNDCHTPKILTPEGPVDDSTRILSGHPADSKFPPIVGNPATPGNWMLFSPDFTAIAGPWGISFTANLTPDSATGLGNWTEENFIRALRTGKHMGQENGRPILPPMPWFNFAKMKDEDLRAVYAYLRTIPPISNRVPAPVSPQDLAKMSSGKAEPATAGQPR